MRGRGLLFREAPSLALPPEERLGIGLYVSADLRAHATCGWSPISLVVVTAADRAAATLRRWGDGTPPPALGGRRGSPPP